MVAKDLKADLEFIVKHGDPKTSRTALRALEALDARDRYCWTAEWGEEGLDHSRITIMDEHDDDQLILNAAAWLHDMMSGLEGEIVIRRYRWAHGMNCWVEVEQREYP